MSVSERRKMVKKGHSRMSVRRQCGLLGLSPSSFYYRPEPLRSGDLELMRRIDEQYTTTPFYGARRMRAWLARQGYQVGVKKTRRLMRVMRLEPLYPKPRLTQRVQSHSVYPYLLRELDITMADHVWASDITYARLRGGFCYLCAVMDWATRYVLAWMLSNTMDGFLSLDTLANALQTGRRPEIFNSDQGSQYTAEAFVKKLKSHQIRVSHDGKGRCLDNVFVERLWRSVKQEHIYLHEHSDLREARRGLCEYFRFYNHERPHQALGYHTPAQVYLSQSSNDVEFGGKVVHDSSFSSDELEPILVEAQNMNNFPSHPPTTLIQPRKCS